MQARVGATLVALLLAAPVLAQTAAQPVKATAAEATKLFKIELSGLGG